MKLTRVLLSILFFALLGLIVSGDPNGALLAQMFIPVADPATVQNGTNEGWNGVISSVSGEMVAKDAQGNLVRFGRIQDSPGAISGASVNYVDATKVDVGLGNTTSAMLDQTRRYVITFNGRLRIDQANTNGEPFSFMTSPNSLDVFYIYVIGDTTGANQPAAVASLQEPKTFQDFQLQDDLAGYDIFRHVGFVSMKNNSSDILDFVEWPVNGGKKYYFRGNAIEFFVSAITDSSGVVTPKVPQAPKEARSASFIVSVTIQDLTATQAFRLGPEDLNSWEFQLNAGAANQASIFRLDSIPLSDFGEVAISADQDVVVDFAAPQGYEAALSLDNLLSTATAY